MLSGFVCETQKAKLTDFDLKRVKPNLSSAAENQVKPPRRRSFLIYPACRQGSEEITKVSERRMKKGDTRERCMAGAVAAAAAAWVSVHMCVWGRGG